MTLMTVSSPAACDRLIMSYVTEKNMQEFSVVGAELPKFMQSVLYELRRRGRQGVYKLSNANREGGDCFIARLAQ